MSRPLIDIQRYLFLDKQTNEVFPVESSFCIWEQALLRSPKYIVARIEYGLGGGWRPEDRFELKTDPTREVESKKPEIPWNIFKNPTCKGDIAFGSACGTCEKCKWLSSIRGAK